MSKRNLVIGLGGLKESGKDTFAEGLPRESWRVIGMSDALFQSVLVLDPWLPDVGPNGMTSREAYEHFGNDYVRLKAESPEMRRLLQVMGTEVVRDFLGLPGLWTAIVKQKVHEAHEEGLNIAVTGIRFQNELEMIQSFATGTTVWIDRPTLSAGKDLHASENALGAKDFEVIVNNEGTADALREKARGLVAVIS